MIIGISKKYPPLFFACNHPSTAQARMHLLNSPLKVKQWQTQAPYIVTVPDKKLAKLQG